MRKKVIAVLTVIFAAAAISCLAIVLFKADNISVSGNDMCGADEIREFYTGGKLGDNTLIIWLKDKLGIYGNPPLVRDHDIEIAGRDSVSIRVYEKSLIACFYYMGQYIYFDKDGMILKASDKKVKDVPCIEGVDFTNFTLYEKIEVASDGQIDAILDLSELISHYGMDIENISFNSNGEVTLRCGKIKVFLGSGKIYDQKIASVSDVLKQAKKKGMSGTIDLRGYQRGDKIILKR